VAERHELADHVLAMLSDDPDQRPALLGNWVAQLRRSSLFPAPAELPLPDRAPGRHPRRSRDAEPDSPAAARRRITARVLALISSVLLIPALITIVVQSRLNSETSNASTFSIEVDGIVLTIGQRLPHTLDLAFVDSQEDFFLPGDIGLPVLEYRDDAGIGLILVNRVIQAIILGPQPRSTIHGLPVDIGASVESAKQVLAPNFTEGFYGDKESLMLTGRESMLYLIMGYRCNVEKPLSTGVVETIIIVARGRDFILPAVLGVSCPDRI